MNFRLLIDGLELGALFGSSAGLGAGTGIFDGSSARVYGTSSMSGAFRADGTSDLSFSGYGFTEGLQDGDVVLEANGKPYFEGRLEEPADDHTPLFSTQAVAYGPLKFMADLSFGEEVRYDGVTASYVLRDIHARAGGDFRRGVEVLQRSPDKHPIYGLLFTEETTLKEGVDAVLESAGMAAVELPGFRVSYRPVPRPGATTKIKDVYGPGRFTSFTVDRSGAKRFKKVVVFRRGEGGGYDVRAEALVENTGRFRPNKLRIFYIPEFIGDQAAARQKASEQAALLAGGAFPWEMPGVAFNRDLVLYDSLRVEREEKSPGRKHRVAYECLIDSELGFEISSQSQDMSLSGSAAIEVKRTRLYDPIRLPGVSPGVVSGASL